MSRLQRATRVSSSLCPSSTPLQTSLDRSGTKVQEMPDVVADVLFLGSQCLFFVISAGSFARAKDALKPFRYILFPIKTNPSSGATATENTFALLEELQRASGITTVDSNAKSQHQMHCCPRCSGKSQGICAVSTLHVEGLHVVLFLVLECDCVMFASFALEIPMEDVKGEGGSSNIGGRCRLLGVRWHSGAPSDAETRRASHKQSSVPVSAILECCGTKSSSSNSGSPREPCVGITSTFSPPSSRCGGRLARSATTCRFLHDAPPTFVLRIVFVRVVGWLEYIDLSWQATGCDLPSPWRALRGFRQVTFGLLRLEMNGNEGGMTGDVRSLHWLPFSRDYQQKYPLLAVLHQHAPVQSDPFLDRLSICMISAREEEEQQQQQRRQQQRQRTSVFNSDQDKEWSSAWGTIRGSCVDGPWCVEALTLAHPSFLLHANVTTTTTTTATTAVVVQEGSGKAGGGSDVLGVFLRPAHIMFPISGLLRERSIYATWEPSAPVFANCSTARDFYFALFTEDGEVARCPVGGFVESASCCPVRLPETRRLSCNAAAGRNSIVAAVLAFRSSGDVLLLEVWATPASSTCVSSSLLSSPPPSKSRCKGGGPDGNAHRGLFSLTVRSVALWGPEMLRPLQHFHQSIALQWDGGRGAAVVLAVHKENVTGCMNCSLLAVELRAPGPETLQFLWSDDVKKAISDRGDCTGVFPLHMDLSSLLHPPRALGVEYNLGAVQNAPLDVLCQCTILSSEEGNYSERKIVIFRSGDICLVVHNSPPLDRISSVAVSCQWLSRVKWPSSTNAEVISALTLLFSSSLVTICMELFSTKRCPTVEGLLVVDIQRDLRDLQMLIMCRSTAILMTTSGQVACVSDLGPSSEVMGVDGAVCGSASNINGPDNDGKRCPFLACMVRPFASYAFDHFFIVSARATATATVQMVGSCSGCYFLFLHVMCREDEVRGTATLANITVVDVIHVAMDGFPLFDFLPSVKNDMCSAAVSKTVLCSREMIYVANAALHSVPCTLECVVSVDNVETVVGRFVSSSYGGGGNSSPILDLQKMFGMETDVMAFSNPSLLRCMHAPCCSSCSSSSSSSSSSSWHCLEVVVVISFVGGLTLAAAVHCGTASHRLWNCQVITREPEAMTDAEESVAAATASLPFVRLVPRTCVGRSGCDILCWMLESDGHWRSLTYRGCGHAGRSLSCDAGVRALRWLDDMRADTRCIHDASTSSSECRDMVFMCGKDEVFTLEARY